MKPLILDQYFDAVELRCYRTLNGSIVGFIGVAEHNIEMLFVAPRHIGKGVGRALTEYAINQLAATNVDVNEQNSQAVGFYQKMGFIQCGRSPFDNQGNPFPLIHMTLSRT